MIRRNSEREELLSATVESAVKLLRCDDLDRVVPEILATLGTATSVDRMQLLQFKRDDFGSAIRCTGHFGWCAPGIGPAEGLKSIVGRDIVADGFGGWTEKFMRGEIVAGSVADFHPAIRLFFEADNVKSVVAVPIFVDDEWWGCIGFDSCRLARSWFGSEIDILKMLAEVIGVALQRARTLEQLADANRIIEGSSTILFRLMPTSGGKYSLSYVSSNIERYGFSASELISKPHSWLEIVDDADVPHIIDAIDTLGSGKASEVDAEFRLVLPDYSRVWFYGRAQLLRDNRSRTIAIEGLFTDITERKQAALQIEKLASTDIVTGLANRSVFLRRLRSACERAGQMGGLLAVHFLDLDGFKQVNDSHGHIVGDELLKAVAGRITRSVREGDLVARFGGDEFAVLQIGAPSVAFAQTTAERICSMVGRPYKIGGRTITIQTSIGVDCSSGPDPNGNALLARADRALYRAKGDGRNCVRVFVDTPDDLPAAGPGCKSTSAA